MQVNMGERKGQAYTPGTHQPEEVVINKVGKDQVSGYVSIPKANGQSTGSATNSGR